MDIAYSNAPSLLALVILGGGRERTHLGGEGVSTDV